MTQDRQAEIDLKALFSANDEEFVRAAYLLILGREADPTGLNNYLEQIRAGRPLRHIGSEIAHSEEGSARPSIWRELLPLESTGGRWRRASWLRRKLFGDDTTELLRGVGRLENRIYRLSQQVKTSAKSAKPALTSISEARDFGSTTSWNESAQESTAEPSRTAALLGLAGREPFHASWPVGMRRALRLPVAHALSAPNSARSMRLLMDGHFSGTYSLAITNRKLAVQLLQHDRNVEIAIQPREREPTDELKDLPGGAEEYEIFEALMARGKQPAFVSLPFVRLYSSWPPVRHRRTAGESAIGVFFWEESAILPEIIDIFNQGYDGIVVSTWFVKQALIDNGCRVPVELVPFPIELPGRNAVQHPQRRGERRWIEFLHVSSCFARKGADVLLRAFSEVALQLPNLRLTIKTFENPHLQIREQLVSLVDPRVRDRVTLLIEDLDDEHMANVYRAADVMVLPTRGEGLNMPAIEAAYYRIPVIATDYTGQADFATTDNSWPVEFVLRPSKSHLERGDSLWCEPSHASLCSRMREVAVGLMKNPQEVWARADRLSQLVHETFLHPRSAIAFRASLQRLADQPNRPAPMRPLRLTFVSSWMEVCGIAEYTRFLAVAMASNGVNVSVLAPEHEHSIAASPLPARKGSWRQTKYFQLKQQDFDADAVWFEHHPAFFELDENLRRLVQELAGRGVPSIITLHSTKELLINAGHLPALLKCLLEFERVVVHSDLDRNLLLQMGLSQNVVTMPHGVLAARPSGRPLLTTKAASIKIGSFGFLLSHKGIDKLIEMVAESRKEPGNAQISLRLVNSIRGDAESNDTYRQCVEKSRQLGVSDAVDWHTDFLPNDQIMRLLSECDVLLLPYQPTNESASGAVRLAMSACAHVLVSGESIFDELRQCCFTVRADSGHSLWLDVLAFLGQLQSASQRDRAKARDDWLRSRDWAHIAKRSEGLIEACLTDIRYAAAIEH